MGRYTLKKRDGTELGLDDARCKNGGVEGITRYDHKGVFIPNHEIKEVRRENLGYEGGKRFDGTHDTSFKPSIGSIGHDAD